MVIVLLGVLLFPICSNFEGCTFSLSLLRFHESHVGCPQSDHRPGPVLSRNVRNSH